MTTKTKPRKKTKAPKPCPITPGANYVALTIPKEDGDEKQTSGGIFLPAYAAPSMAETQYAIVTAIGTLVPDDVGFKVGDKVLFATEAASAPVPYQDEDFTIVHWGHVFATID